jgi:hypothetical protein
MRAFPIGRRLHRPQEILISLPHKQSASHVMTPNAMVDYVLCFLSPDGHIARTQRVTCANDQEAIEQTARLGSRDEYVVELWTGNVMIRRLDPRIN